jgi:HSP20 family protein
MAEALSPSRSFSRNFESFFDDLVSPLTDYKLPACDVEETKESYFISVDLPGLKKEDIKIEFKDGHLLISGERKEEKSGEEGSHFRRERAYGSFFRAVALEKEVDAERIEAIYKDGVLNVAVPKAEEKKGKTIEIKSEAPDFFTKWLKPAKKEVN